MRMTNMFSQTLRDAPADAEVISHKLLVRAGYIKQLGAGVYSLLPLAFRSMTKIENILREEINAINGQEIKMPVVNPAEVWKETNRYYDIGPEMSRFKDRKGADMVLAMTHEEIVADLTRKLIQSYRQLPALVYHIQTKWRDDARPRAGLIRVREFTMKDSYSLDKDEAGLDKQYRAHYQAYFNIFNRCGLPTVAVLSDVGMMGGSMAHEYMYLTPIGEDTLVFCKKCGYNANRQVAIFKKPEAAAQEMLELEKVSTPDAKTIEDLANLLEVKKSETAKAVFLIATILEENVEVDKLIFAIVRGDMELNETKLANKVKALELRPALEDEIEAVGAVPGFASPIGINGAIVVVDDLITRSPNLVAGANEVDFHYKNVNYERDFEADIVADISAVEDGFACHECGSELHTSRGVEVGNIFKLGTKYTDALGASFLDKNGKRQQIIMGSYGIGVGRLFQSVAEQHNDDYGLIWPISIAPYHVHIVTLRGGDEKANELYALLTEKGIEVILDDRNDSPGVKFNDADLIGIPIRVTVSKRAESEGTIEVKLRKEADKQVVNWDDAIDYILKQKSQLESEIEEQIVEVEFKD